MLNSKTENQLDYNILGIFSIVINHREIERLFDAKSFRSVIYISEHSGEGNHRRITRH